jgi:hypothetical protein
MAGWTSEAVWPDPSLCAGKLKMVNPLATPKKDNDAKWFKTTKPPTLSQEI